MGGKGRGTYRRPIRPFSVASKGKGIKRHLPFVKKIYYTTKKI